MIHMMIPSSDKTDGCGYRLAPTPPTLGGFLNFSSSPHQVLLAWTLNIGEAASYFTRVLTLGYSNTPTLLPELFSN